MTSKFTVEDIFFSIKFSDEKNFLTDRLRVISVQNDSLLKPTLSIVVENVNKSLSEGKRSATFKMQATNPANAEFVVQCLTKSGFMVTGESAILTLSW